MDTTFWVGLVNIIVLDIVLSGDNAVVIGMAARTLPERQRRRAIALGTAAAVLLRPGSISKEALETVIGSLAEKAATFPRHSGGLERHYAPRTPARMVPAHALDKEISKGKSVAVLAFSRPDERVDFWLRMPREPQAYAQKLYAALRELDSAGCDQILVEAPPDAAEWAAVRDRLKRACEQG